MDQMKKKQTKNPAYLLQKYFVSNRKMTEWEREKIIKVYPKYCVVLN
jgi:hypothetical protein